MIEVRSSYLTKMYDVEHGAIDHWKLGRDKIWPLLDWGGRIQQMLHGHAQQSLFVWSSEWKNLGEWETAMAGTKDCQEFEDWYGEMQEKFLLYGSEREIFSVLEPARRAETGTGKLEVRSSYLVPMSKVEQASEHMGKCANLSGWQGQNLQMLHGKASQTMFVWSSTWDSLAQWEDSMANRGPDGEELEAWFMEWVEIADFGGPREIFRNL